MSLLNLSADVGFMTLHHIHVEVLIGQLVLAASVELGGMNVEDIVFIPSHQTFPVRTASRVPIVA